MAVRVRDKNNIPKIIERANEINRMKASVGYVTGPYYTGGKITLKGLAQVHEYGVEIGVTDKMRGFFLYKFGIRLKDSTTHIRIPERSFIRTGARIAEKKLVTMTKPLVLQALSGNITVRKMYELLGNEARDIMQETAVYLAEPANAPLTVQNKGFDDPLIETGRMIDGMEVIVK